MKRAFLLFVVLSVFAVQAGAQAPDAASLTGTWKVTSVSVGGSSFSASEQKKAESLNGRFRNARFQFRSGHHCSFDCGVPELRIQDGYWQLINATTVEVREWKDRRSLLMSVLIEKTGTATQFRLDETPFIFTVVKE